MLKDELDTPSLLVDLDKLARNIADMADFAAKTGVRLRPHAKTHKTPEIAKMQLEAGATGLTVAKLSEAEIFTDAGCTDLLIAYPLVGPIKQRRLFELLQRAQVTIVLDHPDIAAELSRAAVEYGRELPVLVDVDTDTDPDWRAIGERLDLRVLDPLTDNVIAATQAATAGLGVDAAVDAVGLTVTRRQCIDAVARGRGSSLSACTKLTARFKVTM